MLELFRDTVIGHLIRWVTHGKLLPHAEDVDHSLWRMYISTEKSTKLEHIVIEKNHRRSGSGPKLLQKRSRRTAPAAGVNTETTETVGNKPAPQPESNTAPIPAETEAKAPTSTPGAKETPQVEPKAEPSSGEIDKEKPPIGGNVGTPGTWGTEETRRACADNEEPPSWSDNDTPMTGSNANTPLNSSSTALLRTGGSTATATPQNYDLDQGWVTAAMGQEGMDVSMQEGQVDGDPALQWHSESDETAWNAVQLEAGEQNVASAESAQVDPAADRVVNVVVWFGPEDPAVSSTEA